MQDKPKAIIFDWDNTLVDTWPLIELSVNTMLRAMGKEKWSMQHVQENIHKSARDALPILFGDRWQEAANIYQTTYRLNNLQNLNLLPNALEVLDILYNDKSIYMAIISNKSGDTLREEIAHLGLSKYFDIVIGSLDTAEDKPSALPVHLALKPSGIAPSKEVWFIGDSVVDVECAINSGCLPIIFGKGEINSEFINKDILNKVKRLSDHNELLISLKAILLN
jgi:phosphoglycolate phosphatase